MRTMSQKRKKLLCWMLTGVLSEESEELSMFRWWMTKAFERLHTQFLLKLHAF